MNITTHQLRCPWKQITVVLLIAGLILWLPAGNPGFSGGYARAQVGFGETSPPSDTSGQAQGGQPTGSDASSGQTSQGQTTPAGSVVSGIANAVADTPTTAGFVANAIQGNTPTLSQSIAATGSAIGLGLSLAGVSFGISLVVVAVVAVIAAVVGYLETPTVPEVPSMVDPDITGGSVGNVK